MMDRYYRHFKGGLYKLITIAKDCETMKRVVIYQALYGNKTTWVRDFDNFFETLTINGKSVKRFSEIDYNEIDLSHELSGK